MKTKFTEFYVPDLTVLFDQCRQNMAENGIDCQEQFIDDGKIHRFSTEAKRCDRDEWYVMYSGTSVSGNPYLCCVYGSWRTGEKYVFKSWNSNVFFSVEQRKELNEVLKKKQKDAVIQLANGHDLVAGEAQRIFDDSLKMPPEDKMNEYLKYAELKGIPPTGVRFCLYMKMYPAIVIDFRNINHEVRTLQYIYTDSDDKIQKRWLTGGEKKGMFHSIPSEHNTLGMINCTCEIYMVEGWATGKSIQAALELEKHNNFVVVVAGDKGNLAPVIENIRSRYPNIKITIAADSDEVGKAAAIDAAKKIGCHVALPVFGEDKQCDLKKYTDFNDLHQVYGVEEVARQLKVLLHIPSALEVMQSIAASLLKKENIFDSFNLDKLPSVLRDYVLHNCETTNAHPVMILSSVLTTASAFMGKHFCIREGEFFQDLYPNIWSICIAGSGQFKTTALNKGAKFAYEKYNLIDENLRLIDAEIKKLANLNPEKKNELEDKRQQLSLKNVLLPNKTTTEGLLEYLSQGHGGAIFQSEFSEWLQSLEKNGNTDLKGIFTVIYDVPKIYRYKTKNHGDNVLKEPFISICAVSTLDWLKRDLKPDDSSSGFFARFLIFTPPQNKVEVPPALPSKKLTELSPAEIAFKNKLMELEEFANNEEQRFYTINEPAKNLYSKMCSSIYEKANSYDDKCNTSLEPFVKRWCPCLLKLAMIMQFFEDSQSNEIGEEALIAAMSILLPAIKSTAQLFEGELGESEHQRKCRVLLEWICQKALKTGKPALRKDILASKKLNGGVSEYDYVLTTLIESGKVKFIEKNPKNMSEYIPQNDLVEVSCC